MPTAVAEDAKPTRLVSLDAFRGATMLLMVLVNDAGGSPSYPQLEHSEWHGWTLTDTVFPSFLWIVGVAITLSLTKRLQVGLTRQELVQQVARRAAVLYALGLFIYLFPQFDWSHARFLGVLQRIAICYFAVSMIYLWNGIRGQLIWIAGLLTVYWILMSLVPVPHYGSGRWDVEGNFAHFVDRVVLGAHNYVRTKTWDPEGIVSTLPAMATMLFGVMAGHLLRLNATLARRTAWLFFIGCWLLFSGMILSAWMPINKKLWTDSFVLLMAGIDFLVFGCFVWLVDELGMRRWVRPLVIAGMNSIAIYVASGLVAEAISGPVHRAVFGAIFAPYLSPENASLAWALLYTTFMFLFAYGLYRKNWFWRV